MIKKYIFLHLWKTCFEPIYGQASGINLLLILGGGSYFNGRFLSVHFVCMSCICYLQAVGDSEKVIIAM